MGDKISIGGNVTGSAVGAGAQLKARNITAFNQAIQNSSLEGDLKTAFISARQAIEDAPGAPTDRELAAAELDNLTEELEKPQPEQGRVRRIWDTIKGFAPAAATVLSSAVSIGKLLSGTP